MIKSAILFPGQGSQQVGMGREMVEHHPRARQLFAQADEILGFPLSRFCFEGPKEILDETTTTQPALYTVSVALWEVAQAEGKLPKPTFVAGHSLGEYSALTAAGALPFEAGLRLVQARGHAMHTAGLAAPGAMAAVLGLNDQVVTEVCERMTQAGASVQVANYNCPGQVVISGAKEAVTEASAHLRAQGAKKVTLLDVSIAAHSRLMASAIPGFAALVAQTPLQPPTIPLVANITARPLHDVSAIREELVNQLTGAVQWTESIRFMAAEGVTHFLEVGPGTVLTGLVKRIAREGTRQNIGGWAELQALQPISNHTSTHISGE